MSSLVPYRAWRLCDGRTMTGHQLPFSGPRAAPIPFRPRSARPEQKTPLRQNCAGNPSRLPVLRRPQRGVFAPLTALPSGLRRSDLSDDVEPVEDDGRPLRRSVATNESRLAANSATSLRQPRMRACAASRCLDASWQNDGTTSVPASWPVAAPASQRPPARAVCRPHGGGVERRTDVLRSYDGLVKP